MSPFDFITAGFSMQQGIQNNNFQNMALAQNQASLQWQKEMQSQAWAREDNAVQRRARDLEAAGLSKTLAAGGAAQASGPISPMKIEAPRYQAMQDMLSILTQKAEISRVNEQSKLLAEQAKGQSIANAFAAEANPMTIITKGVEARIATATEKALINAQKYQSEGYRLSNDLKDVDYQLKQRDITRLDLDIIGKRIDNMIQNENLSLKQKELLIKEVALQLNEHDLRMWRDMYGLPSGTGLDPLVRGSSILGNIGGTALDALSRFGFGK